ncbi:MAG: hypothetical protein EOP84_16800 [Verrucomicrobiaceae bacterium]|nr:MAG: hypothetical protein EOP84_16800 [Verrucomicrobiaceae bacterium]
MIDTACATIDASAATIDAAGASGYAGEIRTDIRLITKVTGLFVIYHRAPEADPFHASDRSKAFDRGRSLVTNRYDTSVLLSAESLKTLQSLRGIPQ